MMSRPPMIPRNVLNNSRGSRPIYVIFADDFGVQGRLECQLELLDAESVAGHLLMAGSFFPFPSGRGRPSVPTDVMASVITLQALHGLSDSETGPTKWLSQSPPEAKPVIAAIGRTSLTSSLVNRQSTQISEDNNDLYGRATARGS